MESDKLRIEIETAVLNYGNNFIVDKRLINYLSDMQAFEKGQYRNILATIIKQGYASRILQISPSEAQTQYDIISNTIIQNNGYNEEPVKMIVHYIFRAIGMSISSTSAGSNQKHSTSCGKNQRENLFHHSNQPIPCLTPPTHTPSEKKAMAAIGGVIIILLGAIIDHIESQNKQNIPKENTVLINDSETNLAQSDQAIMQEQSPLQKADEEV